MVDGLSLPQSQEGDWARPHSCKLAWHGPLPVRKRFIRDSVVSKHTQLHVPTPPMFYAMLLFSFRAVIDIQIGFDEILKSQIKYVLCANYLYTNSYICRTIHKTFLHLKNICRVWTSSVVWPIVRLIFFQNMADLGFYNSKTFQQPGRVRDLFCIILPNFVKIGHTVAET